MSNLIIEKLLSKTKRTDLPEFGPGDTVRVQVKIKEGDKERLQAFEGVVIARNRGPQASFTVRKISFGQGVERIFPDNSKVVDKVDMVRHLYAQPAFADRFLTHMLTRNIRIEQDLIDQLFNSSEKRLARTLLLLARYGKQDRPTRVLPKVSQEVLAEMVGTTRSRVNFFMNKFRKMGFIEYNGGLKINNSLLSVVLHD